MWATIEGPYVPLEDRETPLPRQLCSQVALGLLIFPGATGAFTFRDLCALCGCTPWPSTLWVIVGPTPGTWWQGI